MAKSGEIKGMDKLLKDLQALGGEGEKAIGEATKGAANEISLDAKVLAPYKDGNLRKFILPEPIDKLTWRVVAKMPYSAYMEFGTGGLVDVPTELKEIAIKFKGKGVKQINLRPRPFLYPAFKKGRTQYIEDLKEVLKRLTKKI